jgi:inosine-uridine nucleoside N-ribohydrolase
VRLHLDTDLAGDPDDVAALAYLLGREDVELTGVTTVDDPGGQRAGYVAEVLRLAGRPDVPVAAGAAESLSTGRPSGTVNAGPRYWPAAVSARPGPLDAGLDLLTASVATGAVLVGIGPATTLALLERRAPGVLGDAHVVLMGGWVGPPGDGLPAWRAEDDWNVVCDPVAATEVRRAAGRLTVVPLAVTAQVHLRDRDLPRLADAGPLGRLMAGQAAAYRDDRGKRALGLAHAGLPDDLTNFHHDPLTVAVAAGWPGVTISNGELDGRPVAQVVGVDGLAFGEHWLRTVEALRRA